MATLTSNVGLAGYVWFGRFGFGGLIWFGRLGLAGLVWKVWFGRLGLDCLFWFGSSDTCSKLLPALTLSTP